MQALSSSAVRFPLVVVGIGEGVSDRFEWDVLWSPPMYHSTRTRSTSPAKERQIRPLANTPPRETYPAGSTFNQLVCSPEISPVKHVPPQASVLSLPVFRSLELEYLLPVRLLSRETGHPDNLYNSLTSHFSLLPALYKTFGISLWQINRTSNC